MKPRKPIKRGKPPKRTALKRALPKNLVAVQDFREAVLARARGRCQICPILIDTGDPAAVTVARRCSGIATQAHHRLPRGMGGGGDNDPALGIAGCTASHEFVERNRRLAYECGLLLRHGPPMA